MDWEFAGSLTVTGVVVVFAVLIVLCVIIKLFGLAIDGIAKGGNGTRAKKKATDKTDETKTEQPAVVKNAIADGTVAAISAAVAYMLESCGLKPGDYRITGISRAKRLKRSAQGVKPRSAWSAAGISEAMR